VGDPEVEGNEAVNPTETNQHAWEGAVISSHAQAVKKGGAAQGIAEQQAADRCMGFVDDALRERMVVVTDGANRSIRKEKILMLEGVAAPHRVSV
jgi:hypothetical protein